ncbi:MAG: isoprenylcysteine carboxylmethyltransferase family protein [Oscillospiraceae bacterium]|nr:isoprenylcysteine carboxylmethyltransferase family protein [Oscillospiraceae bacterium]
MIAKIAALVQLGAFYAAYAAKLLILRKQNIRVDLMGKGQKAKGGAALEITLKCVTFLVIAAQWGSAIWDKAPWSLPVFPAMRVTGLLLMLFGLIAFILAMAAMENNWRAGYSEGQNTELVTKGIYKCSRNPAFLGFDSLYAGCALAFPNPIHIAVAVTAMVLFHAQILGEEKFLANAFGQEYLNYKAKTMRYLGRRY